MKSSCPDWTCFTWRSNPNRGIDEDGDGWVDQSEGPSPALNNPQVKESLSETLNSEQQQPRLDVRWWVVECISGAGLRVVDSTNEVTSQRNQHDEGDTRKRNQSESRWPTVTRNRIITVINALLLLKAGCAYIWFVTAGWIQTLPTITVTLRGLPSMMPLMLQGSKVT